MFQGRWLRRAQTTIVVMAAITSVLPVAWFCLQALRVGNAGTTSSIDFTNFALLFGSGGSSDDQSILANGFGPSMWQSFLTAGLATMLTLMLAIPAGYKVGQKRPLSWTTVVGLFAMVGLPPVAVLIPVLLSMRSLHLNDTILGLAIVHSALALPVAVAILASQDVRRAHRQNEIAQLDGVGAVERLYRLLLRSLLPGVVAAGLVAFLMSYTEFFFALILTSIQVQTAPVVVAGFQTLRGVQWGLVAAAAVVLLIPSVLLLCILGSVARFRAAVGVRL